MRNPPVKWRQEWDALLGKKPDPVLAREFGVYVQTVANHRNAAGLKPFPGKQAVTCKCGRTVKRYRVSKTPECRKCAKQRRAAWHRKNQAAHNQAMRERYVSNPDPVRVRVAAWRKEHPGKVREYQARYRRNERMRNDEVIAEMTGVCDSCDMTHTESLRLRILRRMMPCTSQEIHEAWTCIWGPSGQEFKSSAGAQMLRRDLKKLGAVSISRGDYMLRSAA